MEGSKVGLRLRSNIVSNKIQKIHSITRSNEMKKKFMLLVAVVAILVLAFGMLGSGAWWTAPTYATGNEFQAATFDMTIQGTGTDTVVGACVFTNMAPGDDPVECKIWLYNAGSIPINVIVSNVALHGDLPIMADWVFVKDMADSKGQTHMADLASFVGTDGKLSLAEFAGAMNNAWYADPNGNSIPYTSHFIDPGQNGWVSFTFALGAEAPNETIGKSVGFDITLTGQQAPKNPLP